MKILKKLSRFEGFNQNWRRLIVQWTVVMMAGILLALASIANTDVIVLSARQFSWLPVSGMIILILGLLGCVDALFAKHQRDVIQNLQVGVLDIVIGTLIILSISGSFSRLSMMIAAFLLVRGIIRITLAYALNLPYKISTSIAGAISIILGILVFQQWPTEEGWFISLCLNIEIAFRGWAGISFALWVKKQNMESSVEQTIK